MINLTDVADRIVDRAKQLRKAPLELAREYERAFYEDMNALDIRSVDRYERASDYIPQIIDQVITLIRKQAAYETNTGVYFEVNKCPTFGQLAGLSHEELSLRRLELCSSKKNPEDFSLWRKHEKGFGWESPWGFGRPGWHVEDTAISMNTFGETYDMHGGASELMFPHHEAEIAQAEAISGKRPFVRYWLHTGLLAIGGRKMSKSLGNVIRIRDTLREYTAQELRYYFTKFHYREAVKLSDSQLRQSKRELQSLTSSLRYFMKTPPKTNGKNSRRLAAVMRQAEIDFRRRMDDDFDSPNALKVLTALAKEFKQRARSDFKVDQESKDMVEHKFEAMANVLGILPH